MIGLWVVLGIDPCGKKRKCKAKTKKKNEPTTCSELDFSLFWNFDFFGARKGGCARQGPKTNGKRFSKNWAANQKQQVEGLRLHV